MTCIGYRIVFIHVHHEPEAPIETPGPPVLSIFGKKPPTAVAAAANDGDDLILCFSRPLTRGAALVVPNSRENGGEEDERSGEGKGVH